MTAPPRLILEVLQGKLVGRKAIVEPGGRVLVGRAEVADLALPHDEQMSYLHFELRWDGSAAWVKDLRSAQGTELGGVRVTESEVPHRGWIHAGATNFGVHIEGHTPARIDDEDEDADEEPRVAEARRRRREAERSRLEAANAAREALAAESARAPLYAILDAARDPRIRVLLRESVETCRSLYEGVGGEALADVAPYLVRLPEGSRLLDALVREGWGKRWGVYSTSGAKFVEVRRHWRRFLMVKNEAGEPLYFRFYDPRTLCTFLPTCTPAQREKWFEAIEAMFAETASLGLERFEAKADVE